MLFARFCMKRLALVAAAFAAATLILGATHAFAAELVLAERGTELRRQIVRPDPTSDPLLDASLEQTARLIQAAFAASDFKLDIVCESQRDAKLSGIFLGDTRFARQHGVDVSKLAGWSYVHKVAGADVIVAGRDHAPPKVDLPNLDSTAFFSYRLGTLKAATDFLRVYTKTYFLFPGPQQIPTQKDESLSPWSLDGVDLHFSKLEKIAIPQDLDLCKNVWVVYHTRKRTAVLYDIANNLFPKVDDAALGHTWGRAIPVAEYRDAHPEYFALLGGERVREAQYCLSNPQVQELIYQFTRSVLDRGCRSVNILEPDGFKRCQCQPCSDLFGTGNDWGEKLWIFYRNVAQRLRKDCPGKQLVITSYTLTRDPPKSFREFPDNVIIQNVDAISRPDEHFLEWTRVHKGDFGCWLHNWVPLMTTRYTPARTPLFVSDQVKLFYQYKVNRIFRDGTGEVFGLEGPTYYIFGRMFDDPENVPAKDLMYEYCEAAFGQAGGTMRLFYDELNFSIELYSQYLGTHGVGWFGTDIYGRKRKFMSDPYRMIGFLYTPDLIKKMEQHLDTAEHRCAGDREATARLALVRREFDYLRHLTNVVQLAQGYEMSPSLAVRDQLLDAIDTRNAVIRTYFAEKGKIAPMPGWNQVLFPPPGHTEAHLRLQMNDYQHPFADSVFNWDTQSVRKSPLPGSRKIAAVESSEAVTLDTPAWKDVPVEVVTPATEKARSQTKTSFQMMYTRDQLLIRFQTDLPRVADRAAASATGAGSHDANLDNRDTFDVYLAPAAGRDVYYRFSVSTDPSARADAASGLITDMLNLRYGKDDPDWNGQWRYECRIEEKAARWTGLLTIPYQTIGVRAPESGERWRLNVGRKYVSPPAHVERVIWSSVGTVSDVGDRNALGEVQFSQSAVQAPALNKVTQWRQKYCKSTFVLPEAWKKFPNILDGAIGPWLFRTDPLEQGVAESWFKPETDLKSWTGIEVPAFWDESELGRYLGYGWYRTTFKVPKAWLGKPLRLLFAGVDEQAWVYVNGRLVGEQTADSTRLPFGALWELPFTIDLATDKLNVDGNNTLVVRVHNAVAAGGIWRPVLLQGAKPQ